MEECVFCRIIDKTLPCDLIYADQDFVVIQDIYPLAPLHLLVIPRRHIRSLNELSAEDEALAGRLLFTARKVALQAVGADGGYRLVVNTGAQGGQTVFHLHMHILSGRAISPQLLTRGLH